MNSGANSEVVGLPVIGEIKVRESASFASVDQSSASRVVAMASTGLGSGESGWW